MYFNYCKCLLTDDKWPPKGLIKFTQPPPFSKWGDTVCFWMGKSRYLRCVYIWYWLWQILSLDGASVYSQTANLEHILPLGRHCMIIQVKVNDVHVCVNSLQTELSASTQFSVTARQCWEHSVLRAVRSVVMVWLCEQWWYLRQLSINSIRFMWVLGHPNVAGKEIVECLANQALCLDLVQPEPAVHTDVCLWASKEHHKLCQSTK